MPLVVGKLVKTAKSPQNIAFEAEFPLADFDETYTVVENECDNEFNILDSEAETGQDFGL